MHNKTIIKDSLLLVKEAELVVEGVGDVMADRQIVFVKAGATPAHVTRRMVHAGIVMW